MKLSDNRIRGHRKVDSWVWFFVRHNYLSLSTHWRRYRRRETPLPGCCCPSISDSGGCSRLSTAQALPGPSFAAAKKAPINGCATSAPMLAGSAHSMTCGEPWKLLADLQNSARPHSSLACKTPAGFRLALAHADVECKHRSQHPHIPRTPTTRWARYAQPSKPRQRQSLPLSLLAVTHPDSPILSQRRRRHRPSPAES